MSKIDRVEGAIDKSRLSIKIFNGTPCIFYDNVPLWRTAAPLEDLDIFLYDPAKYRAQGEEESYSIFCRDSYEDIYTYGMWDTLEEVKEWLENPKPIY